MLKHIRFCIVVFTLAVSLSQPVSGIVADLNHDAPNGWTDPVEGSEVSGWTDPVENINPAGWTDPVES